MRERGGFKISVLLCISSEEALLRYNSYQVGSSVLENISQDGLKF